MQATVFWFAIAFLSGSLPFSVWLGRLAGKDVRQYGDGNPGATNVWKAGGLFWGAAAIVLDFGKAAVPVLLANYVVGLKGFSLAAVALAPILGHAYSPLLNFQGGKALAATFGIWTGLSFWLVPTVLGISFIVWIIALKNDGRAVLAGMATILILFLLLRADTIWYVIWLGNTILLAWKYRQSWLSSPGK